MNVLTMIRPISILGMLLACVFLAGCATDDELTSDGRSPLAAEPTPPPQPGPRGGWAW